MSSARTETLQSANAVLAGKLLAAEARIVELDRRIADLTTEGMVYKGAASGLAADRDKHRKDAERLRGALREISNVEPDHISQRHRAAVDTATQALKRRRASR